MVTETWKEKYEGLLRHELICCRSRSRDSRFIDDYDVWIRGLEIRESKLKEKKDVK